MLYGRCDEGRLLPHQPFVEALRHYVSACPADELNGQLRSVSGELRRIVPELAERAPGLSLPMSGDPEGARFRLFEAVCALLCEVAQRRPLVLVLDDLHWADDATLLLLKYLARYPRAARMLVLGAFRETEIDAGHPLSQTLAELRREHGFERHALAPLDAEAVARLVRGYGAEQAPPEFHRMLYEGTEGNPLFVVEVLRHLAESGGANAKRGHWASGIPHGQLAVPDAVKDVIARRLARLGPEVNRALTVASVLGREFELAILERLCRLEEDRLVDLLEQAVRASVIEEVAGSVGRYCFSHALIRETLYGTLTATRRALLHRRAGSALEEAHRGGLDAHRAELAHHFTHAGTEDDLVRAITHGTRAGERAVEALAYEQAAAHYRHAAELIDAVGLPGRETQRCDLVIAQGEAERRAGDPDYRATLLRGARSAQSLGDAKRLARAALANSRGLFSSAQGVDRERVSVLHAALAAHEQSESPTRAQLLALLAVELIAGPDSGYRSRLSDEALAIARRAGDPRTLVLVLNQRFVVLWSPHTLQERQSNSREAVRLADQLQDPDLAFYSAAFRSHAAMEEGALRRADQLLDRLAVLDQQLGQPIIHWYHAVSRAKRRSIDGSPQHADQLAAAALEVGQAAGQPDALAWFLAQTFVARFLQGSLDNGEPNLPQLFTIPGLTLPVSPGFTEGRSALRLMGAMKSVTFCEVGRTAEARSHFETLMAERLDNLPGDYAALVIPAMAAVACARLRDAAGAARLHAMLEPHREQFVDAGPAWFGATTHHLGLLAATLGRLDEADHRFAAATRAYQDLGARAWLARARMERAETLLVRRSPGDLRQARELLGQVVAAGPELGLDTLARKAAALVSAAA